MPTIAVLLSCCLMAHTMNESAGRLSLGSFKPSGLYASRGRVGAKGGRLPATQLQPNTFLTAHYFFLACRFPLESREGENDRTALMARIARHTQNAHRT